jgi:fibronectin-binding autotransporter adhesin
MIRTRRSLFTAGLTLLALFAGQAAANDNAWTNATTNLTWNLTSNNWTNPTVWSNANVDSAIFGNTGAGTITVAVPITFNGMQFTANGYTLTGSNALTLTANGSDPLLDPGEMQVLTGITATINVPIGGSTPVNKTFPGTLILGGANTFTGTTLVNNGTLEITGSMTNSAFIGSGATLLFAQSGSQTLSGVYSGSGTLAVSETVSGSTFVLTSTSNTYAGGTQVQHGTLQLGATNAIPTGSIVTLGSGTNPGVLRLSGHNQTIGGLVSSGTAGAGNQVTDFSGTAATLTINVPTGFGYTFTGTLGGAGTNDGNFGLIVAGGGTQYLTNGGNNYSGSTTVNNAYLSVSDVGALGTAQLQFLGGLISGSTTEAQSTWIYTGLTASTARQTILNGPGAIQVSTTGTTLTMSGVISEGGGPSGVTVFGDGSGGSTLVLSAANTYTGPTVIDKGGVLSIATIANGGVASPLGAASNSSANIQLGGLFGDGTLLYTGPTASTDRGVNLYKKSVNGTINVASAGTVLTMSGQFSGPGFLTKAGAGTLVLAGSGNNYAGSTFITGGTLKLGTAAANQVPGGSGVIVSSGAVFDLGNPGGGGNVGSPVGTIALNGGTLRAAEGAGLSNYYASGLVMTGGTVDFTQTTANQFLLYLSNGPITNASGNTALWNGSTSSPGAAAVVNNTAGPLTINVAAGTTSSGIDLDSSLSLTGGPWIKGGAGVMRMTQQADNGLTLTVAAGTLRVDNVAVLNNLSGSIAGNTLTVDGGTLAYGGPTATSAANSLTVGSSNGTINIMNAGTTLTLADTISGPGVLTKIGPGTLVLTNVGNSPVGVTITQGTMGISADSVLGPPTMPVNVGPLGTLLYTASGTTARTIILNSGTLQAAAGTTLALNGANIGGGFLRGPGAFAVSGGTVLAGDTTGNTAVVNVTGTGSFVNFSNNGALTIAAGSANPPTFSQFTNQGSGMVTIAAVSAANVSDFQTYGTLTLNPATVTENFSQTTLVTNTGTSPLYFNGGSRTFIGTPATAVFPSNWPDPSLRGLPTFVAGIDLHGQNAVVAGGLFVNNGYVEDTTNNGQGTATVVADFGSLVKGAGYFQNSVQTINGGKFQAGNSPGKATFGSFVLGPGGVSNYVFAIDDATGVAGPSPDAAGHVSGWGLVKAINQWSGTQATSGGFVWTATPANKLTFAIETLLNPTTVGNDVAGPMDHFNPSLPYSWPAVEWSGAYAGPANVTTLDAATSFDTTGFANSVAGTFGWSLDAAGGMLSLTYTPTAVPEPGTLALTGLAAIGWLRARRRPRGT